MTDWYFQAIEDQPDTSIECGVITVAGTRQVWLKAASTGDVYRYLRKRKVHPNRVTLLPNGLQPTHAEGLDFDLTTPEIDRTVSPSNAVHQCHAFTSELKGGELILKCKTCGAILYEEPRPAGGFYSDGSR